MNIFFIGPASVGKSTIGALLADTLGCLFIDIDHEFCDRIELIPEYIKLHGYPGYCEANSILVELLLEEHPDQTVFAAPAGFLVHEKSPHLIEKHEKLLRNYFSILLLPGRNPQEVVDMVVQRQLSRWDDLDPQEERDKFLDRFEKYKNYGDVQFYSSESPDVIIAEIIKVLPMTKGVVT